MLKECLGQYCLTYLFWQLKDDRLHCQANKAGRSGPAMRIWKSRRQVETNRNQSKENRKNNLLSLQAHHDGLAEPEGVESETREEERIEERYRLRALGVCRCLSRRASDCDRAISRSTSHWLLRLAWRILLPPCWLHLPGVDAFEAVSQRPHQGRAEVHDSLPVAH